MYVFHITDRDIMRSRRSCEVAEEEKEKCRLAAAALSSSSVSPLVSSGMEAVVQEELLPDLGAVLELELLAE